MTSDPGSGYHNHWSETNCASLCTTTEQASVRDSANDHFQGLGTDRKGFYLKFPKSLLNHILSRGSHQKSSSHKLIWIPMRKMIF